MTPSPRLLVLSSPTPAGLEQATDDLADHLESNADLTTLADTLRQAPASLHRRIVVADEAAEAARLLRKRKPKQVFTSLAAPERPVAFMFAGVGDHYPGMAAGLYRHLPTFRRELDRCFDLLSRELGRDLHGVLFPPEQAQPSPPDLATLFDQRGSTQEIHRTLLAQPLAFATQYAMAQSLLALGVEPHALLGYSVGEYAAACLAGVFSLDDALRLVALRARLVEGLPTGAMLAVMSGPDPLRPHLQAPVSIAALDGPELTVLAGPAEAIERVAERVTDEGIACRRLATSHAFHSPMMEPVVGPLHDLLTAIPLRPPSIPFLSNVTGTWIQNQQATDPRYWADHLREPIRFTDQLAQVWNLTAPLLIELGPGRTLTNLAMRHPSRPHDATALRTLPGLFESQTDLAAFLTTAGQLWATGLEIDWPEPARSTA